MGMKRGRSWNSRSPWNRTGPAFKRRRFTPLRPRRVPNRGRNLPRRTGFLNIERKFHDVNVEQAEIAVTGSIWQNPNNEASLLRIGEGNGESDRLGRKITLRTLHIRGELSLKPTVPESPDGAVVIRMIIYQDRQTNGTAATPLEILQNVGPGTLRYYRYRNLSNKSRFNILADVTRSMNSTFATTAGPGALSKHLAINKTLNMPIQYSEESTTGSLSTIRSNNIGILFLKSVGSAAISFYGTARVRYTDL